MDAYAAVEEVPRSRWITFFVPSNTAFAAAAKRFSGAIPQRMLADVRPPPVPLPVACSQEVGKAASQMMAQLLSG